MPYDDLIEKHANRVGISPDWMRRIMRIESGGNASNQTGSYKGLFQLSDREFKANGGSGSIYDPEQNTMAAANKLSKEMLTFKQKYGRDANLKDIYMIHQQGEAGYAAHMANPDQPAWQNVRRYYSSDAMAKKAIWGNVPDSIKAKYGSVENIKSSDFTDDIWGQRLEGRGQVTGQQWARGYKERQATKDEPVEGRGAGSPEEEPKKDEGLQVYQPKISPPNVSIPPTVIGSLSAAPARAPQIPGATRWESG